jgi:hypothetical protein
VLGAQGSASFVYAVVCVDVADRHGIPLPQSRQARWLAGTCLVNGWRGNRWGGRKHHLIRRLSALYAQIIIMAVALFSQIISSWSYLMKVLP